MQNKIKYNAIFALCSILSCGVGAAASSIDSPTDQSGASHIEGRVFHCYTPTGLTQASRNVNKFDYEIDPEIENQEKIQIISIGSIKSHTYNEKKGTHRIITDNNDIFELFINNTSLCFYVENNGLNGFIVDFRIDPNDPTKAIFVKSDPFEHRFDGRGLQQDAITILQKHGFYDDYILNIRYLINPYI